MAGPVSSAMRIALGAVLRSKLRALLTVLGILIGIAAVVGTTALGEGARARINDQIEKLGPNTLLVQPQSNQASGARSAQGSGGRLTEGDARALAKEGTSIAAVAPYLRTIAQVVFQDRNAATTAFGTTRAYFQVRDWPTVKGELWPESAEATGERICLIGATTAQTLFGSADPVGYTVRIGRYPYRIIGLLDKKGESPFGADQDDVVIMPMSSFRSHVMFVGGNKTVHAITFSATGPETADRAKAQAESILRERHRIGEHDRPDFAIYTQAEFRASQDAIYGTLSILLLVVGCVSLLVGGIGIMNIMLVSVAERTREIGIRMALGARERDIMLQFLIEAVVLALAGGAAGTVVAGLGVIIGKQVSDLPLKLNPTALGIALGTSTVIGLFFGFFPARRAAMLDPIVALGRE
jgi:putative ABC transport system permease protein